jgi:hypothetical protein
MRTTLLATAATLAVTASAAAQVSMTPLTTFGSNGWLAPGSTPYLSTANTERGFAYNPLTGNLVLVARQNVAGVSNNIRVLDGASGTDLGGLDNTGFSGGTFLVNMAGCADDGSIYVANLSTSATAPFTVYKWDSEATGFTTPPTVAYTAITGVTRTGDAFAVTGGVGPTPVTFAAAGTNNVQASNFVVGPLDGTNLATAYLSVPGTGTASNDYRLALSFVDGDTLIGNQGGLARQTDFTPGGIATVSGSIPLGGTARRPLDYTVIGNTPVLAVVDTNSSDVLVFDVTDPAAPVQLATANNTVGALPGNVNGVGSVQWGAVAGSTAILYAMSTNQGIQAFLVDFGGLANASGYGIGCDNLLLATNGAPSIGNAGFELVVSGVPAASPAALVGFGTQVVNPGIDLTAVGMAGCFGYTNLDLGLYLTGPLAAGAGAFALPLPADPNLAGQMVSAQGVAFSTLTSLGLASSNGQQLMFGF